jgi:protein-disulfide isomerase
MLTPSMPKALSFLPLVALALACTPPNPTPIAKGPQRSGRKFDPAPPIAAPAPTPTTPTPTTPTPATPTPTLPPGAHPCDGARLPLAPDTVVATLGGTDIRASELGDEAAQAEAQAVRAYCDTVAKIRESALENLVDERLIEKAADGGDGRAWFRAEIDKQVEEPSDADIEEFYAQNKSDETPPLDVVRDQVVAEILRGRQQEAAQQLLARLRKESEFTGKLPEVRLPPPDLSDADSTAGFGPRDAAVHVVEFSDFECPYCARAAGPITELKKKYGDRVRFSFRHFPLSFHPNARPAAEAAQCAEAQDKFWAFHDAVFARSSSLGDGGVRAAAEEAGLDLGKLDACLASGEAGKQVDADLALASEAGVSGTPSFFVDGRAFEGGPGDLAAAIEAALQKQG